MAEPRAYIFNHQASGSQMVWSQDLFTFIKIKNPKELLFRRVISILTTLEVKTG